MYVNGFGEKNINLELSLHVHDCGRHLAILPLLYTKPTNTSVIGRRLILNTPLPAGALCIATVHPEVVGIDQWVCLVCL